MKKPRKPAKKQIKPTTILPSGAMKTAVDQIPLDLLCDMTHHLIRYKGAEQEAMDPEIWSKTAAVAAYYIMLAQASRDHLALKVEIQRSRGSLAEQMGEIMRTLPDVKAQEKQTGRMGFSRGCKRITGLPKREDAERRFYFALPHLKLVSKQPFEHYQKNGFSLAEVGLMEREIQKLPQKTIRKPYERTGKFRRNKQGRKKIPKK